MVERLRLGFVCACPRLSAGVIVLSGCIRVIARLYPAGVNVWNRRAPRLRRPTRRVVDDPRPNTRSPRLNPKP